MYKLLCGRIQYGKHVVTQHMQVKYALCVIQLAYDVTLFDLNLYLFLIKMHELGGFFCWVFFPIFFFYFLFFIFVLHDRM